ncbi:MAG TPA: histidine phosphatase family protein [Steroidobacteraceae bacterium]|nr:histidine phosphatase family protein [Steroidobacteraceae bacterium]
MQAVKWRLPGFSLCLLLATSPLVAQTIPAATLASLRDGGFVIVMRHANSPRETPDAATANADNAGRERQLDATGRRDASAMGAALKRLRIPFNEVLSSPTYRALETARLLDVGKAKPADQLSNEGMAAASQARAEWLREQVAHGTQAGGNRLLITHGPNISAAFPDYSAGMGEGDALVFDPRGKDGPVMVQRVKIGDWPDL